jgi:hypothetical protein
MSQPDYCPVKDARYIGHSADTCAFCLKSDRDMWRREAETLAAVPKLAEPVVFRRPDEHDLRAKARELCIRFGLDPEREDTIVETFEPILLIPDDHLDPTDYDALAAHALRNPVVRAAYEQNRREREAEGDEPAHTCAHTHMACLDFDCAGCRWRLHTGRFDDLLSERVESLAPEPDALAKAAHRVAILQPAAYAKNQDEADRWADFYRALNRTAPESGGTPRARLDANGTAKPLTEIVAVMPPCDDPSDTGRTVHVGQATHYVARPTTPVIDATEVVRQIRTVMDHASFFGDRRALDSIMAVLDATTIATGKTPPTSDDQDDEVIKGIVEERTSDASGERWTGVIADLIDYVKLVRLYERKQRPSKAAVTSSAEPPLWQDYEIDTDDVALLEGFDGVVLMTGDVSVQTGLRMTRETARQLGERLVAASAQPGMSKAPLGLVEAARAVVAVARDYGLDRSAPPSQPEYPTNDDSNLSRLHNAIARLMTVELPPEQRMEGPPMRNCQFCNDEVPWSDAAIVYCEPCAKSRAAPNASTGAGSATDRPMCVCCGSFAPILCGDCREAERKIHLKDGKRG